MKLTIFGDVHGNIIALEKMFKIENEQTDFFVCHGDVVNYGPWTNECISFLNDFSNIKLLKGNHENYFINGSYDGTNQVATAFFEHCIAAFDKKLVSNINKYEIKFDFKDYTIQHTIDNHYIFADTDINNLPIEKNYIIGHSHQQYEREINGYKIFNTGSLGQNRQFINQSCYIKYDTDTNKFELKSFIFDINYLINKMKSDKYPQLCIDYYLSKKQL